MRNRTLFGSTVLVFSLGLFGCANRKESNALDTTVTKSIDSAIQREPTFTDRTWIVTHSDGVAPGQSYRFRSDSVLLIVSPGSRPATGKWSYHRGQLALVEESIAYPTDIVKLSVDSFTIRMHNPGGVTLIEMVDSSKVH